MNIRPIQPQDLGNLSEIDGTIESERYLHVDRSGEGFAVSWRLDDRNLRQKLIAPNPISDDHSFVLRQVVSGADEGVALLAEHDEQIVAAVVAQPQVARTMKIVDLRVDYDFRRQGLATAMVFQVIQLARDNELRAVTAETTTNNFPANQMLAKLGFDLAGVDTHRFSNHDLVKEAVTLFWYASLE